MKNSKYTREFRDSSVQLVMNSEESTAKIAKDLDVNEKCSVTLSADGTKAYIADGNSGLQIVDISDPTNPTIIASVDTPSYAESVTLSADGTKAYIADGSSGLQIIDIEGV